MGFLWCTIETGNMEESLKFYQEIVGLALNKRYQAGPGREMAFLDGDGAEIELICQGEKAVTNIQGISLGFETDDLDQKMAFIKERGIEMEGGLIQPAPDVSFFFVRDPNGVKIQFVERR